MGFTLRYRSIASISAERAEAIRKSAMNLVEGRTWLSCEPPVYFAESSDSHLEGFCKPNFQPHPDDVSAAARESLPDGTVVDAIEVLLQLSRDHGVDWEFRHDYEPGPIGFIRGGICDGKLLEQIKGIAELSGILGEIEEESETHFDDSRSAHDGNYADDDEDRSGGDADDGPATLPFPSRER